MKKILVIDDEPWMLEVTREALVEKGYQVWTAENPDAAFRVLAEQTIDLVLLDLELPGKNGFAVCEEINSHATVPVLFISGCTRSFSCDREDFVSVWENQFSQGLIDILYKPFHLPLLYEKVEALIGASEADAHAPGN
jgi:DNA-binding response OmpR family regulator